MGALASISSCKKKDSAPAAGSGSAAIGSGSGSGSGSADEKKRVDHTGRAKRPTDNTAANGGKNQVVVGDAPEKPEQAKRGHLTLKYEGADSPRAQGDACVGSVRADHP